MPAYDYDAYAGADYLQGYGPQGDYDENGNYVQGGGYDQQAYQQGYYDDHGYYVADDQPGYSQQGYYDENGQYLQSSDEHQGIESVHGVFGQMLGEGSTYTTDTNDLPSLKQTRERQIPTAKPRLYERVIALLKHWRKSS